VDKVLAFEPTKNLHLTGESYLDCRREQPHSQPFPVTAKRLLGIAFVPCLLSLSTQSASIERAASISGDISA
jgi:hypothetical protein